jgi:uncharacterized membrane protein
LTRRELLLGLLAALLLVAYFVAMHLTLINPRWHSLAALFAVLPLAVLAATQLWQSIANKQAAAVLITTLIALIAWQWPWLVSQTDRIYLVQHAGTMLFLAGVFAHSFRHPKGDWVTRLAGVIHNGLTPKMAAYTANVSRAWVLVFCSIGLASCGLYFAGQTEWWSALVNLLTWPIVGVVFVIEYIVRRVHLHDTEHISLLDTAQRVRAAFAAGF